MNPGLASLDAIEAQMREREWESVDSEALASLFVVGLRVLQDEISSQKLRADYLGSVLADRGEQVDELLAYVEGQKGASLANEAWWNRINVVGGIFSAVMSFFGVIAAVLIL